MSSSVIHSESPLYIANRYSLTTNGLTAVACEFKNGGFVQIGNLVIVEMRIRVTSNVSDWGNIVTGFPSSHGMEVGLVAYDIDGVSHILDINGTAMRRYPNDAAIQNKTLNISGCYLTR